MQEIRFVHEVLQPELDAVMTCLSQAFGSLSAEENLRLRSAQGFSSDLPRYYLCVRACVCVSTPVSKVRAR